MKKAVVATAICCVALIGATGATAGGEARGKGAVAKACAGLKKADASAFNAAYGPQHPMKTCIKGEAPVVGETDQSEFKNAADECRGEREADSAAFRDTYGSNKNGKNAFGKCVSSKAGDDEEEEEEEIEEEEIEEA